MGTEGSVPSPVPSGQAGEGDERVASGWQAGDKRLPGKRHAVPPVRIRDLSPPRGGSGGEGTAAGGVWRRVAEWIWGRRGESFSLLGVSCGSMNKLF